MLALRTFFRLLNYHCGTFARVHCLQVDTNKRLLQSDLGGPPKEVQRAGQETLQEGFGGDEDIQPACNLQPKSPFGRR